ncbi:MAG TPA: hypothetical protein VK780_04080 [Thermoanaerobaculia bacterium]|jgi:hypothetical protein|nr:hypothetical protein [Thermoanaerobaculia bacterium]
MKRALGWVLVAAAMGAGKPALAQEACKSVQLKNPPTLSEMYAMADKYAKTWKKDAVPARIGNTSLGPLQPNGSSAAWNLQFYSAAANASIAINTFRGTLTCWAQTGPAGRLPDLKPDFFRDGAKLYALGKQNGEAPLAQGYAVMIQTAAAPSDRHATWYITYSKEKAKDPGVTVIVDGNTGAMEKVLKD